MVLNLAGQVRQQGDAGVQPDELDDWGRQHGLLAAPPGQRTLVDRVEDLERETGLVYTGSQYNLTARIDRINTCLADVMNNPGTATGLRPNACRMIESGRN